jgi:hypothetical protein
VKNSLPGFCLLLLLLLLRILLLLLERGFETRKAARRNININTEVSNRDIDRIYSAKGENIDGGFFMIQGRRGGLFTSSLSHLMIEALNWQDNLDP